MVKSCVAYNCKNRFKKGLELTFHKFPFSRPDLLKKWEHALKRKDFHATKYMFLCSDHFTPESFLKNYKNRKTLRDDAVPTVFDFPPHLQQKKRLRKVKKPSEVSTELKIKQEPEITNKVVLTEKQHLTEKEEKFSCTQDLNQDDHNYPKKKRLFGPEQNEYDNDKEWLHCFICDKFVKNGTILRCLTNTTKVKMHNKLDKIIASRIDLLMNEEEVLCSSCTRLLNYIDDIEVELTKLNRSVFNCIYSRHVLGLHHEELQSMLPNLNENIDGKNRLNDVDGAQDGSVARFAADQKVQKSCDVKNKAKQNQFSCQICSFKTNYKSFMIYHLRQHSKTSYHCDFCGLSLPDGEVCHENGKGHNEEGCIVADKSDNDTNSNFSHVMENCDETLEDVLSQQKDSSCSVESSCKDLDHKEGASTSDAQFTKESDIKLKPPPVDLMNVEDMLEELHKTGRVAAFINTTNNDKNDKCNLRRTPKCETRVNSSCEYSSDKHAFIKLELMNIEESEMPDEIDVATEGMSCQNQIFDFSSCVKSEVQSNLLQDSMNTLSENSGSIEGKLESTNIKMNRDVSPERTLASTVDIPDCGSDVKHCLPAEEIAR